MKDMEGERWKHRVTIKDNEIDGTRKRYRERQTRMSLVQQKYNERYGWRESDRERER